jgi:regulator of nucleoside diphosphate kinase
MKKGPLKISKKDLELLKTHLKISTNLSTFNKQKLQDELKEAIVVKDDEELLHVIRINSEVKFIDVETKQEFNYQLVMPAQANMRDGKLSIYAPIGIAFFGYGVGAEIKWEMPTGMKTFKVISVENPLHTTASEENISPA